MKPTLAPGQAGINGIILHRLFKNKPVYVRPSSVLLPDLLEVSLFCDYFLQNLMLVTKGEGERDYSTLMRLDEDNDSTMAISLILDTF